MFHNWEEGKYIKITKRYGFDGKIMPSLSIDRLNTDMAMDTIFDPRLEKQFGFIQLPKNIPNRFLCQAHDIPLSDDRMEAIDFLRENYPDNPEYISQSKQGILLPIGINKLYVNINGSTFMDAMQKAAYRVIAQVFSFSGAVEFNSPKVKLQMEAQAVDIAVNEYFRVAASHLAYKNGLLRKAVHPRQQCGIFGVLVNRNDLNLDEVLLPRRAVKNWLLNDKYLAKVNIPNDYAKLSNEEFDEYFKNERVLIMAMPDHDENCSLFVKIRLWSGNGIGIHPALAQVMGRDFDGDLIYGKAFLSKESDKELLCLTPDYHLEAIKKLMGKVYKGIGKEARTLNELNKAIKHRNEEVKFMSTDLDECAEIENVKPEQKERFIELCHGIKINDIAYNQATAARDFFIIKHETANAGDMGNQMRVICSMISEEAVKHANDFYHIVAQSALDSKHGSQNIAEKIGRVLRNPDLIPKTQKRMADFLTRIMGEEAYPEMIDTISSVFYDKDGNKIGSISEVNEQVSTINAVIRGNIYRLLDSSRNNDFCVKMLKHLTT